MLNISIKGCYIHCLYSTPCQHVISMSVAVYPLYAAAAAGALVCPWMLRQPARGKQHLHQCRISPRSQCSAGLLQLCWLVPGAPLVGPISPAGTSCYTRASATAGSAGSKGT
jgi:hypothetical protein